MNKQWIDFIYHYPYLKGRESSKDEAWHKPCPNLLEYTSIIVNMKESKICKL